MNNGSVALNETLSNEKTTSDRFNVMQILQRRSIIASVGITSNLTVTIVFLSHRKLRLKIPNRFKVNQVSKSFRTRNNVVKRYFGTLNTWLHIFFLYDFDKITVQFWDHRKLFFSGRHALLDTVLSCFKF